VSVVDVIDQRRECGRFPRASRPGYQHEPAAQIAKLPNDRRNPQFLERRDTRWDETKDSAVAVRLFEEIATEARLLIHLVGKIEIAALLENPPAFWPCDLT